MQGKQLHALLVDLDVVRVDLAVALDHALGQRVVAVRIIQSFGTLNAANMLVALGISQLETRRLCWRPEYQKR